MPVKSNHKQSNSVELSPSSIPDHFKNPSEVNINPAKVQNEFRTETGRNQISLTVCMFSVIEVKSDVHIGF